MNMSSAQKGNSDGHICLVYSRLPACRLLTTAASATQPIIIRFQHSVAPTKLYAYVQKYRRLVACINDVIHLHTRIMDGGMCSQTYGSSSPCCGQRLDAGVFFVAGSSNEGTHLARYFQPDYNVEAAADACEIAEVDFMHAIGLTLDADSTRGVHCCVSYEHSIVDDDADNDDMYVHIRLNDIDLEQHRHSPNFGEIAQQFEGRFYISSSLFKRRFVSMFKTMQMDKLFDGKFAPSGGSRDAALTFNYPSRCVWKTPEEELADVEDFEEACDRCGDMLGRVDDNRTSLASIESDIEIYSEADAPLFEQITKADLYLRIAVDTLEIVLDFFDNNCYKLLDTEHPMHTYVFSMHKKVVSCIKLKPFVRWFRVVVASVVDIRDPLIETETRNHLQCFKDFLKMSIVPTELEELTRILKAYTVARDTYRKFIGQAAVSEHDHAEIYKQAKQISLDIVPFITCLWWPPVAVEWATRSRVWPDKSTVADIERGGVHLIGKGKRHTDIDWRWSFSFAEMRIAELWTADQLFVYFVFKSIFYRFIKPLSPKQEGQEQPNYFPSYLAKTVMMWTSERFPQSWWCEDNHGECLTVLLTCLMSAFECRRLDHYFISSANLLSGIPPRLANRAVEAIGCVLTFPDATAERMECNFKLVTKMLSVVDSQLGYFELIEKELRCSFMGLTTVKDPEWVCSCGNVCKEGDHRY